MKRHLALLASTGLTVGLLVGSPTSTVQAAGAAAPKVTCSSWADFEVGKKWGGRTVKNRSISSEGRSQKVGFRRVTSALVGEGGGAGTYHSTHLVVTKGGKLLEVKQAHKVGSKKFTVKRVQTVRKKFSPHRFGGQFGSFFTISKKGVVRLHEQKTSDLSKVHLKKPRTLPVKLPNPGGVAVWRMDSKVLLYSNNRKSGTLRLVVMPEGRPARAKGYVIAAKGWKSPTHLFAGPCRTPDRTANRVALLAINRKSGNASLRAHYKPTAHGKTLIDAVQVGKGTWKLAGLGQ